LAIFTNVSVKFVIGSECYYSPFGPILYYGFANTNILLSVTFM